MPPNKSSKPTQWHVRRVVVDEPEPGESGTIYEYEVRDENNGVVFTTYEKERAEQVVIAVNCHRDLLEALKSARNAVHSADEEHDHPYTVATLKKIDTAISKATQGGR